MLVISSVDTSLLVKNEFVARTLAKGAKISPSDALPMGMMFPTLSDAHPVFAPSVPPVVNGETSPANLVTLGVPEMVSNLASSSFESPVLRSTTRLPVLSTLHAPPVALADMVPVPSMKLKPLDLIPPFTASAVVVDPVPVPFTNNPPPLGEM